MQYGSRNYRLHVAAYAELISQRETQLRDRLENALRELVDCEAMLEVLQEQNVSTSGADHALVAKIRAIQLKLGDIERTIQRLEELIKAGYTFDARSDFLRLTELPGVVSVRVSGTKIRIRIEAFYHFGSKVYDLGVWMLEIDTTTATFNSNEVRTGRRPGWRHGDYPHYGLPDGSFCFGGSGNLRTINNLVFTGHYVEAITVAVNCIMSVNEGDLFGTPKGESRVIPLVPRAFKRKRRQRA